jgi:hypothetical protein
LPSVPRVCVTQSNGQSPKESQQRIQDIEGFLDAWELSVKIDICDSI